MRIRKTRTARRVPNAQPEHKLQVAVRQYLTLCLPPSVEWTASMAGANLSMSARTKAKAAGVRRGWPDLQFLFPDGVTRYIELKAEAGVLTLEQKAFRARCAPHGIFAVCRAVDEVAEVLTGWGAVLRDNSHRSPGPLFEAA